MSKRLVHTKANFGTAPVFLTALSTILGAVMFLRFGYAVANVGFVGTLAIILIGHAVTIPTALALAEIATNQKVEGGGEYYIISRSFGLIPGAAIGIALFVSQAISVAFYVIAFALAFGPLFDWVNVTYQLDLTDARIVSIPTVLLLAVLVITKGASLGMKLLYVVVAVLLVSLALFFMGESVDAPVPIYDALVRHVDVPDQFFLVFAICFPAFTGMTAGVGLSGDLRDPRKSIPVGTLSATLVGMVTYIAIAYKLATSASPGDLAADQLIMSRIALWGPIIPIGLACATFSSALGSALVAPRTLQALANDEVFPFRGFGRWIARGKGPASEPVNASILVFIIATVFVAMGDVDFVAQVISMFFMVTYGSICLISFLEHFAADPSYRPVFRSRWYASAFGAAACVWLMFKMSAAYAIVAILVMVALYSWIAHLNPDRRGLASIFQGAIFQISRQLQVFLQKSSRRGVEDRWRPAVVCITRSSFDRPDAFDLLRWISHRFGFGTYIHFIEGYLSRATVEHSRDCLGRLIRLTDVSRSNIYVDTLVSPSYTTAVAQVAQLPGISGKENNLILFEFPMDKPDELKDIVENYRMVASSGFDVCILGSTDRDYGYRREIHVWITPEDFENASLMILLSFIILGHPEWEHGEIKLFATFPESELEDQRERLLTLIGAGRLPISPKNVELIPASEGGSRRELIRERSRDADLVILGFKAKALVRYKQQWFEGYDGLANIVWVNTVKEIEIQAPETDPETEVAEEAEPEADTDTDTEAGAGAEEAKAGTATETESQSKKRPEALKPSLPA